MNLSLNKEESSFVKAALNYYLENEENCESMSPAEIKCVQKLVAKVERAEKSNTRTEIVHYLHVWPADHPLAGETSRGCGAGMNKPHTKDRSKVNCRVCRSTPKFKGSTQ